MEQLIIVNKEVRVKEYGGQRVVTLKDAVHERPDGTAGRNFRTNREHFIEGEDFNPARRNSSAWYRTSARRHSRQGYPFNRVRLSDVGEIVYGRFGVQRILVNTYFRVKQEIAAKPARIRSKPEDVIFRQRLRMAGDFSKATGVEIGIAHAVAIKEAERLTGADYTAWKKILPMRTDTRPIPSATEVGKLVGLGAQAVNKKLDVRQEVTYSGIC